MPVQLERERTALEQEVLNGKILRSALQESREYRSSMAGYACASNRLDSCIFLRLSVSARRRRAPWGGCSKVLTEERAALKRDLAELKRLFRLAAEVPPPASVPAGGGCMAWRCSR